ERRPAHGHLLVRLRRVSAAHRHAAVRGGEPPRGADEADDGRAGPAIATRCREPGAAALPPAIDDAIAWMMRKDPAERPPNLQSAMRALEEAAGVEFVSDVPLSRRTPSALTPMPPRRASTEPPRRNSDTAFAHTIDVAPSI